MTLRLHEFRVEATPSEDDLQFLEDRVDQFNVDVTNNRDYEPLAIFVRDDDGQIIAGISGYTWGGCCEIKFLWVHPESRNNGYGRRLLQAVEIEARRRHCHLVVLDTFSFQAPNFYPKFGYTVIGIHDDCPAGHRKYFLQKRLVSPGTPPQIDRT
jgi:GNAT superfamily N-acetyltransferase